MHGNIGQANYAVAKAGIVGLTKTVAKEWGLSRSLAPSRNPLNFDVPASGPFNVRANTVAFGYITTRLTSSKELGETITVNGQAIALGIPGGGKNKQERVPDIPLGRPGSAEEGAKAVLFLVSPLASYVSGHTLEVTGGRGI